MAQPLYVLAKKKERKKKGKEKEKKFDVISINEIILKVSNK